MIEGQLPTALGSDWLPTNSEISMCLLLLLITVHQLNGGVPPHCLPASSKLHLTCPPDKITIHIAGVGLFRLAPIIKHKKRLILLWEICPELTKKIMRGEVKALCILW